MLILVKDKSADGRNSVDPTDVAANKIYNSRHAMPRARHFTLRRLDLATEL